MPNIGLEMTEGNVVDVSCIVCTANVGDITA